MSTNYRLNITGKYPHLALHYQQNERNSSNSRFKSVNQLETAHFVSVSKLATAKITPYFEQIGLMHLHNGLYTLKGRVDFPFQAKKYESGQLLWLSNQPISDADVLEIVKLADKHKQAVHINTGGHGDIKGNTSCEKGELGESSFIEEDFNTALQHTNVSIHIMSEYSRPIYPFEANQIINAWCHSAKSTQVLPEKLFKDIKDSGKLLTKKNFEIHMKNKSCSQINLNDRKVLLSKKEMQNIKKIQRKRAKRDARTNKVHKRIEQRHQPKSCCIVL